MTFRTRFRAYRATGALVAWGCLVFTAGTAEGGPSEETVRSFRFDARGNRPILSTFTDGMLSAFAPNYTFQFTQYTGRLDLAPDSLLLRAFLMTTAADLIRLLDDVGDEKREEVETMMREEILESGTYSTMIYRSEDLTVVERSGAHVRVALEGTLTLHGATRSCPIEAEAEVRDGAIRMRGSFSIRQSDYGITPKTFAFGTVRVRDEITISFDFLARR